MFRNQYDSDVTVWSPQGRLHQVEYAMEAVKLGSATVGLKSKDYAVLVAILRAASELSSSQRKIIPIDDHIGISIAGITADARVLSRHLRTECLNYKYSYGVPHPVSKLITNLGNKMQITTQRYDRRPYGVGLLVAGYDDEKGPRIYQVVPSANFFNCKAMSIGSRSQSSRTYLERHLASFNDCSKDELICHGVQAIRGSLPNEELSKEDKSSLLNISIAIVGRDQPFKILDDNENLFYVNMAKQRGAAIVPSRSDDDIRPPGPDDEPPRTPPTDPDVIVAAMDQ